MTDKPLSTDVTYPNGYNATELTDTEVMDTLYSAVVEPIYRGTEVEITNTYIVYTSDEVILVDSATGYTKEL